MRFLIVSSDGPQLIVSLEALLTDPPTRALLTSGDYRLEPAPL